MLLDTGEKLNALHKRLITFLNSGVKEESISAEVTYSPAPHDEFLKGLRIQKTKDPVMLRLTEDRWLELTGSETDLAKYFSHFYFDNPSEDDHHHPDNADYMTSGSLNLIIEAASTWPE